MEEFKSTLYRIALNNIGTKVVAVLVSLILWIVVLGSRNMEVMKEVSVKVITDDSLMISNDVPEKILFRLEGPKAFLRAILDRRDEPIKINLSGAKAGLQTYRFFADNISLPIGVKVLNIQPNSVAIKLENVREKDVPVKATTQGQPAEGHLASKMIIEPTKARIQGPESRVDMLAELIALPVDISQAKQDVYKELQFESDRLGIRLLGPIPRLHVVIEGSLANFKLKNVQVKTVGNAGKVKLSSSTVQIYIRGTEETISEIGSLKILGTVNLKGLSKGIHDVRVEAEAPSQIDVVRVVPEKISVTIY